jgi:hypothetical protein
MTSEAERAQEQLEFATPEIKAIVGHHIMVLAHFCKLHGKTDPDLKQFLLETTARIYDLLEKLPTRDYSKRN